MLKFVLNDVHLECFALFCQEKEKNPNKATTEQGYT